MHPAARCGAMRILRIALAAAAFAVAAGPAEALYLQTPLTLEGDRTEADVGDDVGFEVGPNDLDENATRDWGGKTIYAKYSYDPYEGSGTAPDEGYEWTIRDIGEVVLDADARGSFTWTVTDDADDKNVVVLLQSASGDHLGQWDLRVGDAEEMYRLAAGTGAGPIEEGEPAPEEGAEASGGDDRAVPAFGLAFLVATVGAIAVAIRRAG